MMKNKINKIIAILLVTLVIISLITVSFGVEGIDPKSGLGKSKDSFGDLANNITGLVQFVGYAFAIGMLIYLGIKYVSSSANDKADLKKGAINYLIGAIIIVAAVNIFKLIVGFGSTISEGGGEGGDTSTTEVTDP